MNSADAEYLKGTVGSVLAKGIAETLAVAPADPVQYLGQWIHRQVRNAKIKEKLAKEQATAVARAEARDQELIEARRSEEAVIEAKHKAIAEVQLNLSIAVLHITLSAAGESIGYTAIQCPDCWPIRNLHH